MKRSGFQQKLTTPMKRTGFKQKLTVPLKRTPFKRKSSPLKKLKKDLMPNRVKRAIKILTKLSHDHVRRRDSVSKERLEGPCFDCGEFKTGGDFQAGHWIADSVGGILLRYHPDNMHGQSSGCNMWCNQERVKVEYTCAMIDKYGREHVDFLRSLKEKKDSRGMSMRADIFFYERMIELYRAGDEDAIRAYLHSYEYMA